MDDSEMIKIELAGDALPGFDRAQVVESLAKSFRVDHARAERLLDGTPKVIKRTESPEEADRYARALSRIGVACRLLRLNSNSGEGRSKSTGRTSEAMGESHGRVPEAENSGKGARAPGSWVEQKSARNQSRVRKLGAGLALFALVCVIAFETVVKRGGFGSNPFLGCRSAVVIDTMEAAVRENMTGSLLSFAVKKYAPEIVLSQSQAVSDYSGIGDFGCRAFVEFREALQPAIFHVSVVSESMEGLHVQMEESSAESVSGLVVQQAMRNGGHSAAEIEEAVLKLYQALDRFENVALPGNGSESNSLESRLKSLRSELASVVTEFPGLFSFNSDNWAVGQVKIIAGVGPDGERETTVRPPSIPLVDVPMRTFQPNTARR